MYQQFARNKLVIIIKTETETIKKICEWSPLVQNKNSKNAKTGTKAGVMYIMSLECKIL